MSIMERLLNSESFDYMVYTICFWVVLYIIVKICTVRAGVGNLLNQAYKRTGRLRKVCLQLRYYCTAKDPVSNLDKEIKMLKKVIKAQKRASKIMTMYLFDDRTDLDVIQAKRLVDGIPDICRQAISKVAEKNVDDNKTRFDEIEENLKAARELLKKASAIDRKNELLMV